jgi:hypothetical protein
LVVAAYELVIDADPLPDTPPKEASVPLLRVIEPRKNELLIAALPFPTTPPDLHTPVMVATEYDSETEPLSVPPAMPPAPTLHRTVVEVTDPEDQERLIVDKFLE